MQALELRVPPLALLLVFGVAMALLADADGQRGNAATVAAALILAAVGAGVALAGVLAFRQHKTTVNPFRPGETARLVDSGIYRFSRNPMYLGFLLMLAGWAAYLASVAAALLLPLFIAYMNRFQIIPEERALTTTFGAAYATYMRRTGRWLSANIRTAA
jgi:protein-S-isoprenylcysteine O-methyltransferase Ste14